MLNIPEMWDFVLRKIVHLKQAREHYVHGAAYKSVSKG